MFGERILKDWNQIEQDLAALVAIPSVKGDEQPGKPFGEEKMCIRDRFYSVLRHQLFRFHFAFHQPISNVFGLHCAAHSDGLSGRRYFPCAAAGRQISSRHPFFFCLFVERSAAEYHFLHELAGRFFLEHGIHSVHLQHLKRHQHSAIRDFVRWRQRRGRSCSLLCSWHSDL